MNEDEFVLNGKKYKSMATPNGRYICNLCAFYNNGNGCLAKDCQEIPECNVKYRKDGKNVYFKLSE